jgi:ATP phosphoribosyltransferase
MVKDEGFQDVKTLESRGEDVAFFVSNLIKTEKKAVGVTGEDLFVEWQMENPSDHLEIIRRYEWKDGEAMFGKPVLCLLGPKGKKLADLPRKLRVAISDKYKKISKHYLNFLENLGYAFEKVYLSGSVEEAFAHGLADIVIDIVYSGKSASDSGLECYDKIFESDIVVIGNKEDFKEVPKIILKK